MVQVDVFWSYGLASGLALASGRELKRRETPFWVNRGFVATLIWISTVFAPSGLYLLWAFPGWETMFVARTHTDIPAWLAMLFAATNITQGILGYAVTTNLLRAGRDRAAKWQPVWSHLAMLFILVVGWDGTGWRRFTYSGTGDDWHTGVELPWTGFFSSQVFITLLGMSVVFVPSYAWLVGRLRRPA